MRMGFPHERVLISVGVQKMVNAKSAGVMFTLDPTTGDPSRIVIEANWGLGESVVSGSVNPDKFVVDRVIFEISEKKISTKNVMSVFDPEKGEVICTDVPPEKKTIPCLNDDEIIEIARCGKQIHEHYNSPQDVEWAIDKDMPFPENVFIVQSRPETVWSQRKRESVFKGKGVVDLIWESVFKKR
jgi:pyruvate,water dikinase